MAGDAEPRTVSKALSEFEIDKRLPSVRAFIPTRGRLNGVRGGLPGLETTSRLGSGHFRIEVQISDHFRETPVTETI